jgi:hypothetical protein
VGWFENFLIPAGERPVKEKGKSAAAGKRKGAAATTLDAFFPGAKKAEGGGSA